MGCCRSYTLVCVCVSVCVLWRRTRPSVGFCTHWPFFFFVSTQVHRFHYQWRPTKARSPPPPLFRVWIFFYRFNSSRRRRRRQKNPSLIVRLLTKAAAHDRRRAAACVWAADNKRACVIPPKGQRVQTIFRAVCKRKLGFGVQGHSFFCGRVRAEEKTRRYAKTRLPIGTLVSDWPINTTNLWRNSSLCVRGEEGERQAYVGRTDTNRLLNKRLLTTVIETGEKSFFIRLNEVKWLGSTFEKSTLRGASET